MVGHKDTGSDGPQVLLALEPDGEAQEPREEPGREPAHTVVGPAPETQRGQEGSQTKAKEGGGRESEVEDEGLDEEAQAVGSPVRPVAEEGPHEAHVGSARVA